MSFFSKGLVAAMEEEMQSSELAIDEAGADSAESDLVEATNISADVEAGTNEIANASNDAEALQRIADVAEKSENEGGIEPQAAEMMEVAVEAIYARLGIRHSNMPALESFAGRSSRGRATRVAFEGIMESVKNVWKAIVGAFKRIVDMVKALWNKLFDVNTKLNNRLTKIEQELRKKEGDTSGKVKATGIGYFYGTSDKSQIIKYVGDVENDCADILQGSQNMAAAVKEQVTKFRTSGLDLAKDFDEDSFYKRLIATGMVDDIIKKKFMDAAGTDSFVAKKIVVKYSDKSIGQTAKEAWESVKDFAIEFKAKLPFTDVPEMDALSRDEMQKLIKVSRDVIKVSLNAKSVTAKIEADFKAGILEAEKIASDFEKDAGDKGVAGMTSALSTFRITLTSMMNFSLKAYNYSTKLMVESAKVNCDYLERSLGAFGGKK